MPVPPLLVIAGATATGKTGLAIRLAETLAAEGIRAEVISADSRQVYRGLDIGTAKPTLEERRGVPHHGIDLVDPDEPFSVADFAVHAASALGGIAVRGGIALLVGGTGFYLRAVARGIDTDALPSDASVRASIEAELAAEGVDAAAQRLRDLAPSLASRVDLRNPRRVARALEIATLRGDAPLPEPRGYAGPSAWVGLRLEAAEHRRRIALRARAQFDAGLIDEARTLRERYDPALPAFSAIGYREAWAVLDGTMSREQAISEDARRNVQFAKRQATWFRAEEGIDWLETDTALEPATEVARRLADAG